ncbi:MAG: prolipoprotein diacylglyceryl transferase [Candidatus Kerfeldbacteria bacterium]|nr:prolipoprotein diacylglyceryl transferase [Candidatus Kerfeldbacteria bacterium]
MAAFFLHTYNPQPIVATFGPFTVHWYGLFLALGALAGYLTFRSLGRRYGLNVADLETLFFWLVIAGVVGARIYHVLNEWSFYVAHPLDIVKIWNGGLAIHGALLAGLIVIVLFARRKKLSAWLLLDLAAPAVAIGQAIGRWGNYFNQELFGRPTGLPWGIPIEPLNRPPLYLTSQYFHPTFLYESVGSFLVFAALIMLHRRARRSRDGSGKGTFFLPAGMIALVYFMAESIVRMAAESLRIDRVPLILGARLPLLVSIVIAGGAAILLIRKIRQPGPRT